LWERCGFEGMVWQQSWPAYDPAKCVDATVEIAVQIGGKLRGRAMVAADCDDAAALAAAKALPEVARALEGKQIVKEIVVAGKLVNLVVK
ncbi:MAG: leucine--tRNA ligase, partial [Oscillospiraceae bacterium]